jgi:hypothetical protein
MKANSEDKGWEKIVEYLAVSSIVTAISVIVFLLTAIS